MILKHVTFYIREEYIEKFIEATLENQKHSKRERGIIRFDFFQSTDDSMKFLLNEEYESEEAMNEHLQTDHFKIWINTVEAWFLIPREKATYNPINK